MLLKSSPEDFIVEEVIDLPLIESGAYAVYVLEKRSWNTEDCLQWLAQSLRIPRKNLGYCGSKDKHAVTKQYVSVLRGPKEVRTPDGISLTYVGHVAESLRLGQHTLNKFTIVVRNVQRAPVLKPIKNYFGEQRFGTNNAEVGFALIRKDYRKACEILNLEFGTDPIGALRAIPRHTLLLYVHAAQSALWNELVESLPLSQAQVPIPGYNPKGDEHLLAQMEVILQRHGLMQQDFIDRKFPELSSEGGVRQLLQSVSDLSVSEVVDGVCTVSFTLPPGQYATETVKQLFS